MTVRETPQEKVKRLMRRRRGETITEWKARLLDCNVPLGTRDVGALFDRAEYTARLWHYNGRAARKRGKVGVDRSKLPAEDVTLGHSPGWYLSTILEWGEQVGRLNRAWRLDEQAVQPGRPRGRTDSKPRKINQERRAEREKVLRAVVDRFNALVDSGLSGTEARKIIMRERGDGTDHKKLSRLLVEAKRTGMDVRDAPIIRPRARKEAPPAAQAA